jgi:chloramphenicol 3-O-phosphotransferase
MKTLPILCLCLLAWLNVLAAPGQIILFNGTSSAGKSSLAEVMVAESKTKYEVVSFDDFMRAYRGKGPDLLPSLYRHAKEKSDTGKNVIIDTVEFDRAYDKYCEILDCPKVVKAIVYCPLQDILKRVERRNNSGVPDSRRPVLLCFQQFLEMYKPQTSPDELVVEKTSTSVIRAALVEAGKKANNPRPYDALYKNYVKAFGIDQDREIVIVPKGKYDLVLNTRAKTKKENVRLVEDYLRSRR